VSSLGGGDGAGRDVSSFDMVRILMCGFDLTGNVVVFGSRTIVGRTLHGRQTLLDALLSRRK
jgi:hypothetical protein